MVICYGASVAEKVRVGHLASIAIESDGGHKDLLNEDQCRRKTRGSSVNVVINTWDDGSVKRG